MNHACWSDLKCDLILVTAAQQVGGDVDVLVLGSNVSSVVADAQKVVVLMTAVVT